MAAALSAARACRHRGPARPRRRRRFHGGPPPPPPARPPPPAPPPAPAPPPPPPYTPPAICRPPARGRAPPARPAVWGLARDGADGVRDVFDHLRGELVRSMALCGVAKPSEITRDLVV